MKLRLFLLLLLVPCIASAQLPRTISVQGALTDNGGRPLADGTHTVRVSLYAASSGGTALHAENFSPQLRGGVFSVVLGAAVPIPANLTFETPYWLGFAVDGAAELTPRTPLTSVPYALHAGTSARAKEADHAAEAATAVTAGHAATADVANALATGATGVVTSVNGADGALTLAGGGGTSVTRNGTTITISSSGGGGTGIAGLQNTDGTIAILNPNGPVATIGVAPDGIGQAQLAPGAVGTDELAPGAVTAGKIADNAVSEANVLDGSLRGSDLADGSVGAAKISAAGGAAGQALTVTGPNAVGWAAAPQGGSAFSLPFADTVDTPANGIYVMNENARAMLLITRGSSSPALEVMGGSGVQPAITANGFDGPGIIATSNTVAGVHAFSAHGTGVYSWALDGIGVHGVSKDSYGVLGSSENSYPIYAESHTTYAGIYGKNTAGGSGLLGSAETGNAIQGISESGAGVSAMSSSGAALRARSQSGDIILAYSGTVILPDLEMKLTNNGNLSVDGTVHTGGADVAEAIEAVGGRENYEPGDVLVISREHDRSVTRCTSPNATNVAGVYATKPGMLLSTAEAEDDIEHLLPLGVIGIIPTKVCGENGPIFRGDLLVTSSMPGHAMKALPVMVGGVAVYPTGAVLGKALENFEGSGSGRIEVLVNVK